MTKSLSRRLVFIVLVTAIAWGAVNVTADLAQASTENTWLLRADAALESGNYDEAIAAYEKAVQSKDVVMTPEQRALALANLGLAHYYKGDHLKKSGRHQDAIKSYIQAANAFTRFIDSTQLPAFKVVGTYYRMGALAHAQRYDELVKAGETFLTYRPDQLVREGLLPQAALGSAMELMALGYNALAKSTPRRAAELKAAAVEYADLGIANYPDVVVHAYLISGLAAAERGDKAKATEYLTRFVAHLQAIPAIERDRDDEADLAQAQKVLGSL